MDSIYLWEIGLGVVLGVLLLLTRQSQVDLRHAKDVIGELVVAAEQLFPGKSGEEKLSWVLAKADEVGLTKVVPATLLRAVIESTVYRLKRPVG